MKVKITIACRGPVVYPKVTIIWLNYNSKSIMDVVLNSLEAIRCLDYPNFELIIVDNGSTDGSFEVIRDYVCNKVSGRIPVKIIRNERNLGFTGGVNVGFSARDPDSKYVLLVNNDAIPEQDSLKFLVEELERRPDVGAAQGIIVDPVTGRVDNAGWILTRYLLGAPYLRGEDPSVMKRPVYVTYVEGSYSIYRVEAILRCNRGNFMFYDELFAYCDDNVLGLKLWSSSYKVISFPKVVARHHRGLTFRRFRVDCLYYNLRCLSFLYHVSNLSFSQRFVLRYTYLKKTLMTTLAFRDVKILNMSRKAWREGEKIARDVVLREGRIDVSKAPLIDMGPMDTLRLLVRTRYVHCKVRPEVVEKLFCVED